MNEELLESLQEQGIAIMPDVDGRTGRYVVVIGPDQDRQGILGILAAAGFIQWDTDAFSPAHALAYSGLAEQMKALEKEYLFTDGKEKNRERHTLRGFLEGHKRRGRR